MDPKEPIAYVSHFTDSYIGLIDLDQSHSETFESIVATIGIPTPRRLPSETRCRCPRAVRRSCRTWPGVLAAGGHGSRAIARAVGALGLLVSGEPANDTPPGLPLEACTSFSTSLAADDFSVPHAISLVTQTRRGEVAVVDVTAGGVVDVDPARPGFNFLPTGAVPTDIVATPGSTAAFVSNGDPVRPGIFGISSFYLFPKTGTNTPDGGVTGHPVPTLGSFPACSLPSIPSQMVVTSNRTSGRAHCDGHADIATPNIGFDLTNETAAFGRQKLLVLMPDVAQIAVIDAQELLARPAGSFDACPIEGTITLSAQQTAR